MPSGYHCSWEIARQFEVPLEPSGALVYIGTLNEVFYCICDACLGLLPRSIMTRWLGSPARSRGFSTVYMSYILNYLPFLCLSSSPWGIFGDVEPSALDVPVLLKEAIPMNFTMIKIKRDI